MKRLLFAALLFMAVPLAIPTLASADTNNFTVTSFAADQTLTRNDRQGELHIVEHISVDFADSNHGILRALPKSYAGHNLQLHVNSVSADAGTPASFTKYTSNGNEVLKIGDASRTITGSHEYTIDYTVKNVIEFKDGGDRLYWDVNGDQWQQPFTKVSVALYLPDDLQAQEAPQCFTGSYGSSEANCLVDNADGVITARTTNSLAIGQTLTYRTTFAKGYFAASTWQDTARDLLRPALAGLLPFVALAGGGYVYWRRNGRDPKGRSTIIPQYDAPDGLKPLQSGAVMHFSLENKYITATIIDLAIRKYVKIIESKEIKVLQKDTLGYSLELTNADWSALNEHEQAILKAIFAEATLGAINQLSDMSHELYKVAADLQKSVRAELIATDYFAKHRLSGVTIKKFWYTAVFLSVWVVAFFIHNVAAAIGTGLGVLIGGFFLIFIDARTAKGVAAKEHLEGLKLYLNVAEKDRIAALQSPGASLAANANEPVKTVELFEKLLPYAIVLGVEAQWGKQFEQLYTAQPDWYVGNMATFNSAYLATSIASGIGGSVESAFSAPSSSSGGGGFSGGGGGGGGGGGW